MDLAEEPPRVRRPLALLGELRGVDVFLRFAAAGLAGVLTCKANIKLEQSATQEEGVQTSKTTAML